MRDARCDDIGDGNSNRQRGRLFTSGLTQEKDTKTGRCRRSYVRRHQQSAV